MTHRHRQLFETIDRLRRQVAQLETENTELWHANADLALERDTADQLLGQAFDPIYQYGLSIE